MAVADDPQARPLSAGLSKRQLKQLGKDFNERRVKAGIEREAG